MLIVLPPSEGKQCPVGGGALDLGELSFPGLDPVRRRVLQELVRLCSRHPRAAAQVLGLGPTQSDEVARNATLAEQPCAPAIEVYSGVLYQALGASALTAAEGRRLRARVAISSGLFGLLRPQNPIPAYRLSGSVTLPRVGTLASAWKPAMNAELTAASGPIVDLRSGTYASLGAGPRDRIVVRVRDARDGRIVSHANKTAKGRIARALVIEAGRPASRYDVIEVLQAAGLEAQVSDVGVDVTVDVTG